VPSLLSIGDPQTLRNRYSGRTIFLVEGPGDKNVFQRLLGPGYEADIEFQVAPAGGGEGGCKAVMERVPEQRGTNPRVFGLLDGEAAASFAAAEALLTTDEILFQLGAHPGFIFLGAHELENIYFGHADVCATLADQATAAKLHMHPAHAIASTLESVKMRFTRASVYKYTSAHFHSRQQVRAILNTKIFGSGSWRDNRSLVETAVTSGTALPWSAFVAELVRLGRIARDALRAASTDPARRRAWFMRIADGKEMLSCLRERHGKVPASVEGVLLREVCRGPFPGSFREALFILANVQPSTSSI
jgi:hypothetical protein